MKTTCLSYRFRCFFESIKQPALSLAFALVSVSWIFPVPVRAETAAGTALRLDGVNDFVAVSNSAALNVYPLTIMIWFQGGDFGPDRGLVNKYVTGSLNGYQIYLSTNRLRAWYFRDAANYVWDGALGMDAGFVQGGWHHAAFTVDATGGKLYLDGILRASRPWTGTPGATTQVQDLQLGRYANNFLNGWVDEVSVWNVALSSNAIAGAMNRRLATNETGLLGYWRFDEGSGSTTADFVPQRAGNNTGTLFGGPSWFPSVAPIGPIVFTRPISRQTMGGAATLNGEVTAFGRGTTAWFEWGTNASYGNVTGPVNAGTASTGVVVSAVISGLQQGRTYHYRVVATNLNGRANGANQSFTQPVYPQAAGTPPLRSSSYDAGFASFVAYDPRPEWDVSVPMTIEAWVYRRNANRFETILSHDWPGSYRFGFAPNLRFYRGTNFVEVPTPIPAFKWTHVAVSYDGTVARFYINGDYIGARSVSNTGAGKLRPLLLGHDDSHNDDIGAINEFWGSLDEVRLWSVARSASEIRDGLYREVRGEPGLAAAFPRGGRFEEVHGLVGNAGSGVTEQIYGMAPRDLVVPLAAIQPVANGQINPTSEYLGADQLVIRYPDDPTVTDGLAYFIRTTNDLFVGVAGHRRNIGFNWPYTNTWLGLFLDTTYERPPLSEYEQVQLVAYQDYNANHTAWLNGDGGGSYYSCIIDGGGIIPPRPCTPRSLWQVGEGLCGDDVDPPPPCTEFRVSRTLLGSFDQYDGVAIGHFNFSQFGDQQFVPEDGFSDSPMTWLTMSYGEGSATLPRVRLAGRVFDGLTNTSPGLAGWRVTMFAGGAVYTNLTDAMGRYSFDAPMPTGQVVYVQIPNVGFGRYRLPNVYGAGIAPSIIATNEVRFPGIAPGTIGTVTLRSVDFFIQRPIPASGIVSATPASPVAGYSGRIGAPGGLGEEVTIYGSNLHAEVEIYLSPFTTFINPPQWTLLRAPVLEIAADRSWMKVLAPFVPDRVPIYQGGFTINSFQSNWRWVSYDRWTRPNMITYTYFGNFPIQRPPYPLVHGFTMDNQHGDPTLNEFLACYGNRAYLCVGCCGFCATRIPDPLYWGIWWPVYEIWISESGGSCVGMGGTSLQFFNGVLDPQEFDADALTAIGIRDPGFPGQWDTSNTGGRYTRPPKPRDVWARIRMNHGAQTSAEYIFQVLAQLDIDIINPSFGGNPVARLNTLRANPTGRAICMIPGAGGGHCVTPYKVEDNYGGDPNISRIWLYDNNDPCDLDDNASADCVTGQYIDINRSANSYRYPRPGGDWTGTGLFTIPLSVYNNDRHMPGLDDIATYVAVLILVVAGDADAHYSTPQGEWGWRPDGTFVDNLPGLAAISPIGSPDNMTRSVPVFLSLSNQVFISNSLPMVHMNVRSSNRHVFHAGLNGTLLQLETSGGPSGVSNQIQLGSISNQLTAFSFKPQVATSNFIPKVGFQVSNNACATFQWIGLTGEGGKVQEFRALKGRRAVEYCNLTGNATRHYLRVDAVDGETTNNTCAVFGPFNVPTGAVHCVVLNDWPRGGKVRSELDLNADGRPDEVTDVTGAAIDSDGDGIPDAWESLNQLDPEAIDCDDDADKDRVSNYDEYLAGTDPHNPNSYLRLTATVLPNNRVRLTWNTVPGRRYEVLWAEKLWHVFQPLPNSGFPRLATGTQDQVEDALTPGDKNVRFYRLRLLP
jgi:hypothetical protein